MNDLLFERPPRFCRRRAGPGRSPGTPRTHVFAQLRVVGCEVPGYVEGGWVVAGPPRFRVERKPCRLQRSPPKAPTSGVTGLDRGNRMELNTIPNEPRERATAR